MNARNLFRAAASIKSLVIDPSVPAIVYAGTKDSGGFIMLAVGE